MLEDLGWTYGFLYYTVAGFEAGYFLLPEPPEDQNIIHPAGWYRSTDEWNDVMCEQLGGLTTPTNPELIGRWMGRLMIALLAIALLGAVVVVIRQQIRAGSG